MDIDGWISGEVPMAGRRYGMDKQLFDWFGISSYMEVF